MKLRKSRKMVSILVTLSMLLVLLVPLATPAGAISTNHVSKIVSLNDDFNGDTGVDLTLKEDDDFLTDFTDNDIFQLVLPEGVNWNDAAAAGVTGATADIISDQIMELTVAGATYAQDTISVPLDVEIDGADGDIAVKVDPLDAGVTGGSYVFARITGDNSTAEALSVETIGDPGVGGSIRISESSVGSLGNESQEIKLKLPTDFSWATGAIADINDDGTVTEEDYVSFSGGFAALTAADYSVALDENEMVITFDPSARTNRGLITINTPIDADKDADYAEIEVSITGDEVDDADVVVADYADYGVDVTIDSTKDILAGKFDQELDTITIEESVPGTLIEGRDITLVFPEWVKITDADVDVSGGGLAASVGDIDGTSNELDLSIDNSSSNTTGKIELKDVEVSVEGNKTGDIEMTVDGSKAGIPDNTKLVVGKAVALVTAAADATKDVKIGVQGQEIGTITITELIKEAISDEPNGTINHNITLTLPEGVWFTAKPKVEITEGNLDIDSDNITLAASAGGTADAVLNIPVDGTSSKISTVKVTGVKVTADRTVPTGDLMLKVGGGAIIENAKANRGWLNGSAAAPAGDATTVDEGEFDTGTAVKMKIANIITPAPGETTGVSVFKIGETTYTLNGATKTMDVAPYIKNDRTYIPLRFVANAAGVADANIMWNDADQSVVLIKGDRVVKLVIGSTTLMVNGTAITMDTAPELVDPGRTMLPVRAVAQALGCSVTWDEATQTVTVTQ